MILEEDHSIEQYWFDDVTCSILTDVLKGYFSRVSAVLHVSASISFNVAMTLAFSTSTRGTVAFTGFGIGMCTSEGNL
jgi:hypothetical protein